MLSNFEKFQKQLNDSVQIIDETKLIEQNSPANLSTDIVTDTQSILSRCESVCRRYDEGKPKIRVVHHLACSGGSLISKCLAGMPNVFLLSEVHPLARLHLGNGLPKFTPSDVTSCSHYAGVPNNLYLSKKIFRESIKAVYEETEKVGGVLILREHTHTDYCVGDEALQSKAILSSLSDDFDICSLITIRNPIDSYASLLKNGWVQFTPATFDEYCKRLLQMLETYQSSAVFYYENFVLDPEKEMSEMCDYLDIEYNEMFQHFFEIKEVTGDSGRSGTMIGERQRRNISDELQEEINSSKHFKELIKTHTLYSNR